MPTNNKQNKCEHKEKRTGKSSTTIGFCLDARATPFGVITRVDVVVVVVVRCGFATKP
jgi:hypothetical protein